MFAEDPDFKVSLMQGRYGGYWRYPQLLDFCYLVNPYFPPQRLIDEVQANFTPLLTQYPSGMRVNALLAGKNFAVHQDNIVVGNGAAELIKALMARLEGVTGFIRPTFEEYPNRCQDRPNVCFTPAVPDFRYTADDLMAFFGGQTIDNLVLINPDNPSGNYIPAGDVRRLIRWAEEKGIRLIVDESFADFADEADNTFIRQELLDAHKRLYVVKSISKSYGVPGLRLLLAEGEGLTSNYAYMPVTFDEAVFGESRDEVMSRLAAEGIGARKYFYPLVSDYACYRETYHSSETPVARHLASQVLTLPLFEELGAAGADEICDVILKGPGSNPRK